MSEPEVTKGLLEAIGSVGLRLDSPDLRERAVYYRQRMAEIAVIAQLARVMAEQPERKEMYLALAEALTWSDQTPAALLKDVFDQSGVTDALDAHFHLISGGLTRLHLPNKDVEFVRQCGATDPEAEILLALAHLQSPFSPAGARMSVPNGPRVSTVLTDADETLQIVARKLKLAAAGKLPVAAKSADDPDLPSTPAKKRKMFNGIGKILTGVVGGTGNVLIGTGTIVVSGGATAAAVFGSAAASIGFLMQGIGDLRGE